MEREASGMGKKDEEVQFIVYIVDFRFVWCGSEHTKSDSTTARVHSMWSSFSSFLPSSSLDINFNKLFRLEFIVKKLFN